MKITKKGFTLVEIMIVVAIIAILAAVAIPNFINYRKQSQATACINNLKQIQSAKEQALMAGKTAAALTDLVGNDKYIKTNPTCPTKGSYTIGDATTDPTCSIGETQGTDYKHVLPSATTST